MKFNYKPLSRKTNKQGGFTLMETLLALLILSLILQSLMTCLSHFRRIDQEIRSDLDLEWQHFCLIFEQELQHFTIQDWSNSQIELTDPQVSHNHTRIILNKQKIYKTPGHQPYLYQVRSWRIIRLGSCLNIQVEFTNQQVYRHLFKVHFIDEEASHEAA